MEDRSQPDWGAELTPAPRPRQRPARPAAPPATELGELLERVARLERLLAEQSAVLAEVRDQVARLAAPAPGAPAQRRRVLTAKT